MLPVQVTFVKVLNTPECPVFSYYAEIVLASSLGDPKLVPLVIQSWGLIIWSYITVALIMYFTFNTTA